MDMYQEQMKLEYSYSAKHARKMVKQELGETKVELIKNCANAIRDWALQPHYKTKQESLLELITKVNLEDLILDILTIVVPYTRTSLTAIAGQTAHLLPFEYNVSVKRIAEIIYQMALVDLLDVSPARKTDEGMIMVESAHCTSDKLIQHLLKVRYVPPMVCEPNVITNNITSPFLTIPSPVMSKHYNQHDGDICLDILNMTNTIPLSIDEDLVKRLGRESKDSITKLLSKANKYQAMLEANIQDITIKTKLRSTQVGIEYAHTLHQQTNEVIQELLALGNKFYLPGFYDARGRLYVRGYHVSTQGNSYRKALINFGYTEEVLIDDKYKGIF